MKTVEKKDTTFLTSSDVVDFTSKVNEMNDVFKKHGFDFPSNDFSVFKGGFSYSAGEWNGKSVWYRENGQMQSEGNWKDGNRDGKYVEYRSNGQIFQEGNYRDGERCGKWVGYDEAGNMTSEKMYDNGVCVEGCK